MFDERLYVAPDRVIIHSSPRIGPSYRIVVRRLSIPLLSPNVR